jgi:hypothetical protein
MENEKRNDAADDLVYGIDEFDKLPDEQKSEILDEVEKGTFTISKMEHAKMSVSKIGKTFTIIKDDHDGKEAK